MTTILTEIGWEDGNGNLLGRWTNQPNVVDRGDGITVDLNITAKSLSGNDSIAGTNADGIGIDNDGTINTGTGNDTLSGNTISTSPAIFNNGGTINTGTGNDSLSGDGYIGILNRGTINTGTGDDSIFGRGVAGINNVSTINTGTSNDSIFGQGRSGIVNNGTINTGAGNDSISGQGTLSGITNGGIINTGGGNDTVDALTGGFSSGGTIDLGVGRDLIRGFGAQVVEQIVDGGRGFDTAELGIDFDENQITFGSTAPTSIDITFDSATMSFTDVESFDFNGQVFALEQLQDIV